MDKIKLFKDGKISSTQLLGQKFNKNELQEALKNLKEKFLEADIRLTSFRDTYEMLIDIVKPLHFDTKLILSNEHKALCFSKLVSNFEEIKIDFENKTRIVKVRISDHYRNILLVYHSLINI